MKQIIPFTLVFILFFSFGCQKNKEEKINGNWEYVYLSNVGNTKQIWTFNKDKSLIRSITIDSTISDTASWKIEAKAFSRPNLTISNLDDINDGIYEVLTLSKKFLIIERISLSNGNTEGAFNRIEFVKSK